MISLLARDDISISWQASQRAIPDVNEAHVETVHMTLTYPVDVIVMSPLHIGNHCQTDIIRFVAAYIDWSQMMLKSIALMILRWSAVTRGRGEHVASSG